MTSTIKNLLTTIGIVIFLIICLFVYSQYFASNTQTDITITQATANSPGTLISEQLDRIEALDLQSGNTLFADTGYLSLHDGSVVLGTENAGRNNPFAPVNK